MNTTSKSRTSKEEPIPGLRDFFASSALSVLGNLGRGDPETMANYCYRIADAMLIERDKPRA